MSDILFPKRLVMMSESQNDSDCLKWHIEKHLTEIEGHGHLFVDPKPILTCSLGKLIGPLSITRGKQPLEFWLRQIQNAARRSNVGAILLLTDGDDGPAKIEQENYLKHNANSPDFCVKSVAHWMIDEARKLIQHMRISVGIAVALNEYETWLVAARGSDEEHLTGILEQRRDGKTPLNDLIEEKYLPSTHQLALTRDPQCDWERAKTCCRSFRHFHSMVGRTVDSVMNNTATFIPEI